MASMNISLPDSMKDWVDHQISGGKYASTSDYVRDLIRHDQENREKIFALKMAIQEGLDSGVSDKNVNDIWSEVEKRHTNPNA